MYRRRLDWPGRFTAILFMVILDKAHSVAFGHPQNTPLGVTVYCGTAALFSAAAVVFYSHALQGCLAYDMQRLALCAIFLNASSWIFYMAQESPSIINFLMKMVTYGMFLRVCWINDDDTDYGGWRDLLRRCNSGRQQLHTKAANS